MIPFPFQAGGLGRIGGAQSSTLWTPASLTSPPAAWWNDSSTITDVSGVCSQWDDLSGNGYHWAQATLTARPAINASGLNGRRTLEFVSNDYMTGSGGVGALTQNRSVVAAWAVYQNRSSSAAVRNLFVASTGTGASTIRFALQTSRTSNTDKTTLGVRRQHADSFASLSATTSASTNWTIGAVRMDYANGDGFVDVNGTRPDASNLSLTSTGSTDNVAATATFLGCDLGTSVFADMNLAELIVVTAMPSSDEMDKIEGYLAHRWGLTANLPALHPYKSVAP